MKVVLFFWWLVKHGNLPKLTEIKAKVPEFGDITKFGAKIAEFGNI